MATTKGIMGYVDLGGGVGKLRVSSLGLRASQELSPMDTIDAAYDNTAYRLGPVRIEGDMSFPIPVLNNKWLSIMKLGIERNSITGQLQNKNITVDASYDHLIGYRYEECSVNTMSVSIASEEALEVTMNLIGTKRIPSTKVPISGNAPERVLTWNEVQITSGGSMTGSGTSTGGAVVSDQVRNFSFEVNNNNTVFFALKDTIFALKDNIVAGKREVTGSMEAAWNGGGLANFAYTVNADNGKNYCQSDLWIQMDLTANCGASSALPAIKFWGILYNMEEISMTNDFFMGTQTWRAYGNDSNEYKAISLGGVPY